jgi:proline iminopeptidase
MSRSLPWLPVLLGACAGEAVDDHLTVLSGDAVLPVHVRGNMGSGTLLVYESGGPSGPGIAERRVGYVDLKDTLEPELAVAFYDRRGVGNAHGDYAAEDLSMEVLVEDLHAVISVLRDRYAPERVVLMGHSWGGYSSASYLLAHPDAVDAWVPVAPAMMGGDDLYIPYRRAWLCRVAADLQGEAPLWDEVLGWCADHPSVPPDSAAKDELWDYLITASEQLEPWPSMDAMGLLGAIFASHYNLVDTQLRANRISGPLHAEAEGMDLLPELGAVTVPTLVITGEYDPDLPTELGDAIVAAVGTSDAEVVEIEGAGHYPMDHDPSGFAAPVLDLVGAL